MAYIKLEDLQKIPIRIDHYDKENGNMDFVLGIETAIEYAEHLPAADVEEVKHGEWEYPFHNDIAKCTNCGFLVQDKINNAGYMFKYCPNCGAKMDGGKTE